MKKHRVRKANCIDSSGKDHLFIEVEKDRWLECKKVVPHKVIHQYLKGEKRSNIMELGFATRAFDVGLIRDWREAGSIK